MLIGLPLPCECGSFIYKLLSFNTHTNTNYECANCGQLLTHIHLGEVQAIAE